jgi:hypothetical protein
VRVLDVRVLDMMVLQMRVCDYFSVGRRKNFGE